MVKTLGSLNSVKQYKNYKQYNFSSWKYSEPIYLSINIKKNINVFETIELSYLELFDKNKFKKQINYLIKIKYEK
jgi:hypothetical protein